MRTFPTFIRTRRSKHSATTGSASRSGSTRLHRPASDENRGLSRPRRRFQTWIVTTSAPITNRSCRTATRSRTSMSMRSQMAWGPIVDAISRRIFALLRGNCSRINHSAKSSVAGGRTLVPRFPARLARLFRAVWRRSISGERCSALVLLRPSGGRGPPTVDRRPPPFVGRRSTALFRGEALGGFSSFLVRSSSALLPPSAPLKRLHALMRRTTARRSALPLNIESLRLASAAVTGAASAVALVFVSKVSSSTSNCSSRIVRRFRIGGGAGSAASTTIDDDPRRGPSGDTSGDDGNSSSPSVSESDSLPAIRRAASAGNYFGNKQPQIVRFSKLKGEAGGRNKSRSALEAGTYIPNLEYLRCLY